MLNVNELLDAEIFYTSDGSYPTAEDEIFTQDLTIDEKYTKNGISYIRSSVIWEEPQSPVFEGHTLKFMTFDQGCPSSELVVADYFVRPNIHERYPLPVLSISFEKDDFFGDLGILVPGVTGSNFLGKGDEWERRAYLSHFDNSHNSTITQPIDVRVRGRGSRENSQKSLRLYARDKEKKTTFNYPFFSDRDLSSYKRVALRSGHSDFTQSMIKDLLSAELVENLDVDYMEAETSIVFMNGEYWGIQNVRENLDKYYLESHYGVNPDSVTIVKFQGNELIANEGTVTDFEDLLEFARQNDLAIEENFKYVLSKIDVSNFIDYFIAEIYFSNWDWPKNNQRVWRPNHENGKYRWMFYDCDGCFYRYSLDKLTELQAPEIQEQYSISLLKNMLQNQNFRDLFHSRYVQLISTEFSAPVILSKLDSLENLFEPLLHDHISRWSQPASFISWLESIDEMKVFAVQRPSYALAQLEQLFGSPITIYPNPSSAHIKVKVGIETLFQITIRDVGGKLINSQVCQSDEEIDIRNLKPGIYFITVKIGDSMYTEKFIKISP